MEEALVHVRALLQDEQQYKKLPNATGDEAQKWLDLLHALSSYPGVTSTERSSMCNIMLRLSKRSGLCPQCLTIENVNKLGNHPIGGGGFGDVWKGKIGEQVVCLKVVKVYLMSNVQQLSKEYVREAIVWQQLKHPNVLPFMGIFYLDGEQKQLCLISPWMERGNLVDYLKETPKELVNHHSLARDIAAGLSYLHDMKIAHGDLKGVNILITLDRRACIGDFGLSRVADTHAIHLTSTTGVALKGTTRWQAPELLKTDPPGVISTKSDMYAFGCVCYELFTGRVPFYELKDVAVIVAVLVEKKQPSRPAPQESLELDDLIWEVMVSCWDVNPDARPNAGDVLAFMSGAAEESSLTSDGLSDSVALVENISDNIQYGTPLGAETIAEMRNKLDAGEQESALRPDGLVASNQMVLAGSALVPFRDVLSNPDALNGRTSISSKAQLETLVGQLERMDLPQFPGPKQGQTQVMDQGDSRQPTTTTETRPLPDGWEEGTDPITGEKYYYYIQGNHRTKYDPRFVTMEEREGLPKGWELVISNDHPAKRKYFINHNNRTTTWQDPRDFLPPNWELRVSKTGRNYYVDHNHETTSWLDPRLGPAQLEDNEVLPSGWEMWNSRGGRRYFINYDTHTTTWDDPRVEK